MILRSLTLAHSANILADALKIPELPEASSSSIMASQTARGIALLCFPNWFLIARNPPSSALERTAAPHVVGDSVVI
jgi:hypothetical protein